MEKINRNDYEKKVINLFVRSPAYELPSKRNDRLIVLHALSRVFKEGTYSEKEVNELIKGFLAQVIGFKVDHVKIRRALVDEGFLERTKDGARYTVDKSKEIYSIFEDDINDVNPKDLIRNAIEDVKARRKKYSPGTS